MLKHNFFKSLNPWRRGEQFLVLEISPQKTSPVTTKPGLTARAKMVFSHKEDKRELSPESCGYGTSGVLVRLDAQKRLTFRKAWEDITPANVRAQFRFSMKKTPVIVAADPAVSCTVGIPVDVARETIDALESVELENTLAQAVGRVFTRRREEAARALGAEELDVVLARSRVSYFKIDGHRVVNPLGFKARKIGALLELTLTTREVLNNIKMLLPAAHPFFFTESGRSELSAIEKLHAPPIGFVMLADAVSPFARMHRTEAGYETSRGAIAWSLLAFRDAIADAFGVSAPTAEAIYRLHAEKKTSVAFARAMRRALGPVNQSLFQNIEQSKLAGKVFLDAPIVLPFRLPFRRKGVVLDAAPVEPLLAHFGLSFGREGAQVPDILRARAIAPFLEYYYDTSDTTINHWLRRHLSWLGSSL